MVPCIFFICFVFSVFCFLKQLQILLACFFQAGNFFSQRGILQFQTANFFSWCFLVAGIRVQMRKTLLLQAKYRLKYWHLTRVTQACASKYQGFYNLKIWQCTGTDKSKGKKETTTQLPKAISSNTMTNSVIQILLYFVGILKQRTYSLWNLF